MKKALLITLALVLALAASCGGPSKKMVDQAEPLIKAYLLESISHPETYEAISTKYLGRGLIDKDVYTYSEDGPTGDSVAVRVFSHAYTHLERTNPLRYVIDNQRRGFLYPGKLSTGGLSN